MTDDPKAALRKAAFAARKVAHQRASAHMPAATAHLLRLLGPVRCVAGYMPIRSEIDPRLAMTDLAAQGARIGVPVIESAGAPLRFREWSPGCAMVAGPFGALVPAEGDWMTPEALIVPLVAFDAALNRLGYGGGFYDRTLEGLRRAGPVRAVGFAYSAQELPDIPAEPTDQRLDALVTENGPLAAPGAGQ